MFICYMYALKYPPTHNNAIVFCFVTENIAMFMKKNAFNMNV